MYHYEDLLKAEQKALECDLFSLLELNRSICQVQSKKSKTRGAFVFQKLSLLPNVSPALPRHFYSTQFALHLIRFLIAQ